MNFYQYLNKNGLLQILDGSPEKIDEIKKIYQKENRKEYKRLYQKKRVHRVIIFTLEEDELFKQGAKNHNLPISTFIRESALNYLTGGYIVPDKEQTHQVIVGQKRHGTLLNQIAHQVNASKTVTPLQIQAIREIFNAQDTYVKQIFTKPIRIEEFVQIGRAHV